MGFELTETERDFLSQFSSIPFLPVAKSGDDVIFLEDERFSRDKAAAIILSLEKKGVLQADFDIPLSGFDYQKYGNASYGSLALTPLGQETLDGFSIV